MMVSRLSKCSQAVFGDVTRVPHMARTRVRVRLLLGSNRKCMAHRPSTEANPPGVLSKRQLLPRLPASYRINPHLPNAKLTLRQRQNASHHRHGM